MSAFDESLHPRQRTGEFAAKRNAAPTGTLTAEPGYLGYSDDEIPVFKIQPSDQPGIWLSVDRAAFLSHLGLHPDNSDETVATTLRLLADARIDVAFIGGERGYEDPGTAPTPVDTTEWGPEWSDAYAWTGEDDPDSRYVRATQTVTLDRGAPTADATSALTAYARFLLIDLGDPDDDIEVATEDGQTFTIRRTVPITAGEFSHDRVRDAHVTAGDRTADRLRRSVLHVQQHGKLIPNADLHPAEPVNLDAVLAARRFGRPLANGDLAAFAQHLYTATHGASNTEGVMREGDRPVLLGLSRGFVEDQALARAAFDRVTRAVSSANRDIASSLADAFRNSF